MGTTTGAGYDLPTGEQFEIVHGVQRATVTEVGATLRGYTVGDRDVIDGFGARDAVGFARGQVLAPWPNRIDEGEYSFEGVACRAPWDEPARRNAIHGLVRWRPWQPLDRTAATVTMACTLNPSPAYRWWLRLEVTYALDASGLTVTTRATNRSDASAPFGLAFHPYLTLGGALDDATLTLAARTWLPSDERLLPTGREDVDGTDRDFRRGRAVGATQMDTAFTDLERDEEGVARVTLSSADRRVTLWADNAFGWLMVYTADTIEPERRRRSIAVEPMTCPPNAFVTGEDVIALAPGEPWAAVWGITPG
jgi:aldose 1-epimerase